MSEAESGGLAAPGTSRLAATVGVAGALVLGAVFLFAAWAKALDPVAFAEQIKSEGLAFLLPANVVAVVAIALEVGLGLALLLNLRRWWVLLPTTALVAFFVALTGRACWLWKSGTLATVACGCFGNFVQRTPCQAFWQDLALLGIPLLAAYVGRPRTGARLPILRTVAVAVVTLAMVVLAWWSPELPLDDLATRLSPGTKIAGLCVPLSPKPDDRLCLDGLIPDLDAGRHLVVLADLAAADAELVGQIDRLAAADPSSRVVILVSGDEAAVRTFTWQFGPSVPVKVGPEPLLRGFYRRLPRTFLVEDGVVTATWPGVPTLGTPAA